MLPIISIDQLACLLKLCRKSKCLLRLRFLQRRIYRCGLDCHTISGNLLVRVLSDMGSMQCAHHTFQKLKNQNKDTWNALIVGYIKNEMPDMAFGLFHYLKREFHVFPSSRTCVELLKTCARLKDVEVGLCINDAVTRMGLLEKCPYLYCTLIDMYAKCSMLNEAKHVFSTSLHPDVVSWTTLISGYADTGQGVIALQCFEEMLNQGVFPNAVTFLCCLKACNSIRAMAIAQSIHSQVEWLGLLAKELTIGNALISMYVQCDSLLIAEKVFEKLPVRDVLSWTTIISGLCDSGQEEKALSYFDKMQEEKTIPDVVTFVSALKACGKIRAIGQGISIHTEIERKALLQNDVVIGTTLVEMYARFRMLSMARQVFENIPVRDVITWNLLIVSYAENGYPNEVMKCFDQMQVEGLLPDAVTISCVLKACVITGAFDKGQQIHTDIKKHGDLIRDPIVGTALIDMYAKFGHLQKSQEIFDQLVVRDTVSWNSIISRYTEYGQGEEALQAFEMMNLEGVSPNSTTFISSLKACCCVGAIDKAQELHADIERRGLLDVEVVGNTLVTMYAKSGCLVQAQQVFNQISVQDVVSWTALMAGYAQFGESNKVFQIFERMQDLGIKPNLISFIIVLSTCRHSGLYERSKTYFEAMTNDYGIVPSLEHHSCVIDLLGRTGKLQSAIAVLENMPLSPNIVVWQSLLSASKNMGDSDVCLKVFNLSVNAK